MGIISAVLLEDASWADRAGGRAKNVYYAHDHCLIEKLSMSTNMML